LETITRFIAIMALAGWAGAAQALIMTYNNLADWTNAIGGAAVVSDPFNNDIAQAGSITFDSGVVSSVLGIFFDDNSVYGGKFNMAVAGDGVFATPFNDWLFPNPIFAFGFNFTDVRAGAASVLIDDGSGPVNFALYSVGGGSPGFAGFVSDIGMFSHIRFNDQESGTDAYDLDNLVFAESVPAPATLALFGLGLAGLGWSNRMKKKVLTS